jgi:endonuclease/exonuclease/phosphatase family metal-dependent hydrolase
MSTLLLLSSNICAEAITEENIKYFKITTPPVILVKAAPTRPVGPIVSSKVTPPASSVALKLESDGIWRDTAGLVLNKQISDHALAGQMVDGDIPIYTWNTWGFQSKGGFGASNNETNSQYQNGRLKEQIGILFQIFNHSPEAIICLQEVNEQSTKARTAILNALKGLNIGAEYLTNTGTQSFGQVILYRKDQYVVKGKSDFKSNIDSQQNNRAHKVFFNELAGNKRQFAVVNVHLAVGTINISGLLDELIAYAQGLRPPKPLAVIVGDFNYTVGQYKTMNNPKVKVTQVGESVAWNGSASSIKPTARNVDGFIIVQP